MTIFCGHKTVVEADFLCDKCRIREVQVKGDRCSTCRWTWGEESIWKRIVRFLKKDKGGNNGV